MEEIRGVWIANRPHSQVLSSQENIAKAMDFLAQMGFNVVFPVVWNQGFTLYPSAVMRQNFGAQFEINPDYQGRNPLQEVIEAARERQIAVMPWFEYGFACSARADGGHILAQKPHFAGHQQNDNHPLIKGGLTWMNALNPQVQEFMLELIVEVATNFDVQGIQGDDRLPAFPIAGFDDTTAKSFQAQFHRLPLGSDDQQWKQFRADILTNFLAQLRAQIKAVRPNLVVSMAPSVFPFSLDHFLQDSKTWVERGLVDLICPQVYRETLEGNGMYRSEINKIKHDFAAEQWAKFAPGIAFKAHNKDVSSQDLLHYIDLNRNSGFQGQVFFHYEGLQNRHDGITVAEVLRQGPYSNLASLPVTFSIA